GVDSFELGDLDVPALGRSLARADVAIDAMFGTGFRGALDGVALGVADAFAVEGVRVVAVDIPSGVDGATGEIRGEGPVRGAVLVSHAAQRAGGGMVVAALPGGDTAARASGTEVVTRALPVGDDGALDAAAGDAVVEWAPRFRALVVGPGLGRGDGARATVRR